MKILFINSIKMFGGGEVWLLTMMQELTRRGHQVHLLCRPYVPLEIKARARQFNVHTIYIRSDFDPFTIYMTWKLIRRLKVDVVCTNMDKELRFGGIAARLAGVRAVVPRRGIDYPLKNTWTYRLAYNHLATGVIANSIATRQSLLKNCIWLKQKKIKVIYNGVDPGRFDSPAINDIREEMRIPEKDVLIGFVGQLDERKGVETLLSAYMSLPKTRKGITLLLIGEGAQEGKLREMSKRCRNRIIFTGFRSDVDDIMKKIDLLVLPSIWEGFGIVLIEAMAAGKPVITTNVSNMPEIVDEGKEGFLVPPKNEKALADAMIRLIGDSKKRKQMGTRGQEKMKHLFTLKRMVDETEKYFNDLTLLSGHHKKVSL